MKFIKRALIIIFSIAFIVVEIFEIKKLIFKLSEKEETKELEDIVASTISAAGFSAGSLGGSNMTQMYYYVDEYTYCGSYTWQLIRRDRFSRAGKPMPNGTASSTQQQTTYGSGRVVEMAQSVAFARYYSRDLAAIQDVVWGSYQWSTYTDGTCLEEINPAKAQTAHNNNIKGRSYQFANFVYRALDGNEKLNLTGGPTADENPDINIIVDQDNSTYTVGPFELHFGAQDQPVLYGNGTLKDLVRDEIINGHKYIGQFCKAKVTAQVKFQDGSYYTAEVGAGSRPIEILDGSGNVIPFPYFDYGQVFYIRYHSSIDDKIVERIKPIIKIDYTKRFSASNAVSLVGKSASSSLQTSTHRSVQAKYTFGNSLGSYLMLYSILENQLDLNYGFWMIDDKYPYVMNEPFKSWDFYYTKYEYDKNDYDGLDEDLEFYLPPGWEHPGGFIPDGDWDGNIPDDWDPSWGLPTWSVEDMPKFNDTWTNNTGNWYVALPGDECLWGGYGSDGSRGAGGFSKYPSSKNVSNSKSDEIETEKHKPKIESDLKANIIDYLTTVMGWNSSINVQVDGVVTGFFVNNTQRSSNGLTYRGLWDSGGGWAGNDSFSDQDISWHPRLRVWIEYNVEEKGEKRWAWEFQRAGLPSSSSVDTVWRENQSSPYPTGADASYTDDEGVEWNYVGNRVDKAHSKPYKISAKLNSNEGSGIFSTCSQAAYDEGQKWVTSNIDVDDFEGNPGKYWKELMDRVNENIVNILLLGFTFTGGIITEGTDKVQPAVRLERDITLRTTYNVSGNGAGEEIIYGGEEVNLYLGGNVWQDMPSSKVGDFNGHKQNTSLDLSGIEVKLYDVTPGSNKNGRLLITTTTDKQGRYGFQKLNPLHKYQVIFTYDGMRFESTLYNKDHSEHLRGEYSVAQESKTDRTNFNTKYETIDSSPHNYYNSNAREWRRAYGLYQKIEDEDGTYVKYSNSGINAGSFRYYDALEIFKSIVTNGHNFDQTNRATMGGNVNSADGTYYNGGDDNSMYRPTVNTPYSSFEGTFKAFLKNQTIGNVSNPLGLEPNVKPPSDEEINNIWLYIMDTLISSSTIAYPDTQKFILKDVDYLNSGAITLAGITYPHLYTIPHDQSRQVDFGLKLRTNADLWLSNDVYKATILINGKKQEYFYDKKRSETDSQGNWVVNGTGTYDFENGSDSSNRANDDDYNGTVEYDREIRKSEYLYNGEDAGTTNIKNLQVFVTYKIALKNQSTNVFTKINEVVDYYDSDQYTYAKDRTIVQQNTFLGDANGNKIADINVSEGSIFERKYTTMQNYYAMSYNINDLFDYKSLYITGIRSVKNNSELLESNEFTYLYITFMVNTDPSTGKVKIEQDVDKLLNGEIVNFTGKKNIAEINGYSTYYLNIQENKYDAIGVVDLDSNPGSLRGRDLNPESGLIMSSLNSWENRLQDDTDNSRNISLKIYNDPSRSISGYTYEDARTKIEHGATIGNGVYNSSDTDTLGNSDKKINGITVQLVELQQNVDDEGFSKGTYSGEHIWSSLSYSKSGSEWIDERDSSRYSSGTGKSKVIIQGTGIFEVKERDLDKEYEDSGGKDGVYMFDSLPPGDFVVRFIYGDTTETVLTNDNDNEVIKALNKSNEDIQEKIESELVEDEYKYDDTKGTKYGVGYGVLGTKGLNSKSYTGQDYKSTIYQLNVKQDKNVNFHLFKGKNDVFQPNGVVGYNDIEGQNYNRDNADDRASMYNYSFYQSDKDTKIDQTNTDADAPKIGEGISDAKDVWSYRSDEQNYSSGSQTENSNFDIQTLKNHRAEVLASGTQLTTKAKHNIIGDTPNSQEIKDGVNSQKDALIELMQNTRMVAQTGLISTQLEYDLQEKNATQVYSKDNNLDENGKRINIQNMKFDLRDVDLGLTERPRAQLIISKELVNIQIRLANNQILFDTTQSVPNLSYGQHKIYEDEEFYESSIKKGDLNYKPYMLRYDVMKKVDDRQEELVSVIMDEELMYGATVRLKYKISVDNIGEVDYQDKNFYYNGETVDTSFGNIAKTNAIRVIDYVTNEIDFDENYQNDPKDWVTLTKELILGEDDTEDDDLVNKEFEENLNTYTTLISTDRLSGELIPRYVDPDTENYSNSRREIELVLSTLLANTVENKNLVYANMVEILETTNSMGRRMYLSEAGNQEMPYQSEEDSIDESTKWIHPDELDTDSGQKVQVSVPTGGNKEYSRTIIVLIISLTILGTSSIIIKKKVLDI